MSSLSRSGQMRVQPRRGISALWVVATGVIWLASAWPSNWPVAVLGSLPGLVLVATGVAHLLWAGDRQVAYHTALAAVLSVPLAVLLGYWLGAVACVALLAGSAGSFVLAGWMLRVLHVTPPGVTPPGRGARLLTKMAVDAALLGFFVNCARVPRGGEVERDRNDLIAWGELAAEQDWQAYPDRLHGGSRALASPRIVGARHDGWRYQWLTAASRYTPDSSWPGTRRWLAHRNNHRFAARILRHDDDRSRPWLICVHGYRMGVAQMDFQLFDIARLHHHHGLNLLMPILPLHGSRGSTLLTGSLFLDGPLGDLVHAQAQALCDLRSCLAWLRGREPAASVGVLGYSLGGYHAALLSSFEPELACVIAGIPMTDIPATLWRHLPGAHAAYLAARGLTPAMVGERLAPVSPLHLAPRVSRDRRFIFAARGDQLVAPTQALALWEHWERPALQWYEGSHLSVRREADVSDFIDCALGETGLTRQVS